MINAEKFKDEINEEYLSLLKRNVIDGDGNRMNKAIKTIAFKHCGKQLCGASSTFKWLCEEYKEPIKLTRFERDILKHCLYKNRNYIARDYNDTLRVYGHAPKKGRKIWENLIDSDNLNLCEDMFLCVSWNDEKPQSIVELLKDCEVVNDAEE